MTIPTVLADQTTDQTLPLDIVAEEWRYENLFRIYERLSDRERSIQKSMGNDQVPDTLCTKISGVDFESPLAVPDNTPFTIDSNINKFCIFLWNMLDACDSGSTGADACRLYWVLEAAVEDILSMKDKQNRIEHLLGLTMAIVNQGLWAFFERGDSENGQDLFKLMANEWKKFFDRDPCDSKINHDVRKLALGVCETMKTLLKSTRKKHGEYAATYNFNYIRIPRKRGSSTQNETIPPATKKTKTNKPPTEAVSLLERINRVEGVSEENLPIYDSCVQVRRKIRAFLQQQGMTKAALCRALGNINHKSLNDFMVGKGQERSGNITYKQAFIFFEKQRVLEKKKKTSARIRHEIEQPHGFPIEPYKRATKYVYFIGSRS